MLDRQTFRPWRRGAAMVLGSFLLYCAQDVAAPPLPGDDTNGPVSEVMADEDTGPEPPDDGPDAPPDGDPSRIVVAKCCPTPDRNPSEILFEDVLTQMDVTGRVKTPAIDVSAFRSVVIHATGCSRYDIRYKFGVAGFVNGPEAGLSVPTSSSTCDPEKQLLARVDTGLGDEIELSFKVDPVFGGPDGVAITVVGRR